MKIVIELPEWCDERDIRVMAGIELAAYKLQADNFFHVKKVCCNNCGDCCRGLSERWLYGITENHECQYLKQDGDLWICSKLPFPIDCFWGKQAKGLYGNKGCVVEYDQIKDSVK
jgi:hypothetical protein